MPNTVQRTIPADSDTVRKLVGSITSSRDLDSTLSGLHAFAGAIGVPCFAVLPDLSSYSAPAVDRRPDAMGDDYAQYRKRYSSDNVGLNSPIHSACRAYQTPFVWRTEGKWSVPIRLERRHQRALGFLSDNGVKGGICVPVHMPGGRVSSLRFYLHGTADDVDLDRSLSEYQTYLSFIGLQTMQRFWAQSEKFARYGALALTARELDCINRVAAGQSDRQIAQDLLISPQTVRYYVDKVVEKLDAKGRINAVAKAAQLGMISSTL